MNQQVSKGHRWKPGQSGNPAGRPVGARQRIAERLLEAIAEKWELHGDSVLDRLAADDPKAFAQIAYGLLPRDVFVSVEQRTPGNLDAADWALMLQVLDTIKQCASIDARPAEIFATIEGALRSHFAKPVCIVGAQDVVEIQVIDNKE